MKKVTRILKISFLSLAVSLSLATKGNAQITYQPKLMKSVPVFDDEELLSISPGSRVFVTGIEDGVSIGFGVSNSNTYSSFAWLPNNAFPFVLSSSIPGASFATDINKNFIVVGDAYLNVNGQLVRSAVFYDYRIGMHNYAKLPQSGPTDESNAIAINNNNDAIGFVGVGPGPKVPVFWPANTRVPVAVTSAGGFINDLNNNYIVGGWGYYDINNNFKLAYQRVPGNCAAPGANTIDDSTDTMAGYCHLRSNTSLPVHRIPIIWDTPVSLPRILGLNLGLGSICGEVVDIEQGVAVGFFQDVQGTNKGPMKGFIDIPNSGFHNVNDLVNLPGVNIEKCLGVDVSNAGKIEFVCEGKKNGMSVSFKFTSL